MIFYVALDTDGKHHLVTTQALASEVNKTFEQIDIPTDKPGLRDFVQGLLDRIDAQEKISDDVHTELNKVENAEQEPIYTEQTVFTDELWEQLPLARKFHFAADAMEQGRSILSGLAPK